MNKYSVQELGILRENRLLTYQRLGEMLGRTPRSIESKMRRLGISHPKHKFAEGAMHPNWKGGRIRQRQGYVLIKVGANYVLEHRLVWERANGKPVPPGFVVHHLNGIRDDNRSENLVAIRKPDHEIGTLARLRAEKIQELETRLREVERK